MKPAFVRVIGPLMVFVAAEGSLYLSYQEHDARFHWFLHFFVGASTALIVMGIVMFRLGRTIRSPFLWIFAGHLGAMLPDIFGNLRLATHQAWMDLFLAHISAHFVPGRNWTWYVIFLVSLAFYLYARAAVEAEARQVPSLREPRSSLWHAPAIAVVLVLFDLHEPVMAKTPVWIDTDPAPNSPIRDKDDLFALLVAFGSPELHIRGISLVFGNHHDMPGVLTEIEHLTARFSATPISVYTGAQSSDARGVETEASAALIKALEREPLVILSLGPLTNVAGVLQRRPDLVSRIRRIVAVAGRRPNQEFVPIGGRVALPDLNFESDIEAFQAVLRSRVPMTLIPFELSRQIWISLSDLEQMRTGNAAAAWFAAKAVSWLDLWTHGIGTLGFNPFDGLALSYLTSREFFTCETDLPVQIRWQANGSWFARLFGRQKRVLAVSRAFDSPYHVEYCTGLEREQVTADLLARLNAVKETKQ